MESSGGFYFKIKGRTIFLDTSNYNQLFNYLYSLKPSKNNQIYDYTIIIKYLNHEKLKFITDRSLHINHFQNDFYLNQNKKNFFKLEFNNFNEPYEFEFNLNGKI